MSLVTHKGAEICYKSQFRPAKVVNSQQDTREKDCEAKFCAIYFLVRKFHPTRFAQNHNHASNYMYSQCIITVAIVNAYRNA